MRYESVLPGFKKFLVHLRPSLRPARNKTKIGFEVIYEIAFRSVQGDSSKCPEIRPFPRRFCRARVPSSINSNITNFATYSAFLGLEERAGVGEGVGGELGRKIIFHRLGLSKSTLVIRNRSAINYNFRQLPRAVLGEKLSEVASEVARQFRRHRNTFPADWTAAFHGRPRVAVSYLRRIVQATLLTSLKLWCEVILAGVGRRICVVQISPRLLQRGSLAHLLCNPQNMKSLVCHCTEQYDTAVAIHTFVLLVNTISKIILRRFEKIC